MNENSFLEFKNKKDEYLNNIVKLDEDLKNLIINQDTYRIQLNNLKNQFKSYLGPLYQIAKNYLKKQINYELNIWTTIKSYNAQLILVDTQTIMNNEEFNVVSEEINYKIKNSTLDNQTIDLLLLVLDYVSTYHGLLMENAPKRDVIKVEPVEVKKEVTPEIKKEKIKVSAFIKFLPTILTIGGLIIAYIIYTMTT